MKFVVEFKDTSEKLPLTFKELVPISDGGYERGYEHGYTSGYTKGETDGHDKGYTDGYEKGHTDGLAQREYEVWTITLVDGSIVEKEVALL